MKTLAVLLSLFLLPAITPASNSDGPRGAWLEDGVKWVDVRADINPHLQWAQVQILYFETNRQFGFIYCTVNRTRGKDMSISPGDPRGVYKGEWEVRDNTIAVTYRLVEATILRIGQELPGPVESRTIDVSAGMVLTFAGKTFRRAPQLDKSSAEAIRGMQVPRK